MLTHKHRNGMKNNTSMTSHLPPQILFVTAFKDIGRQGWNTPYRREKKN